MYTDLILVLTISVSSTAIRNTVHWSETAVGSGTTIICTKSACETHPNNDEIQLIRYYLYPSYIDQAEHRKLRARYNNIKYNTQVKDRSLWIYLTTIIIINRFVIVYTIDTSCRSIIICNYIIL